MIDFVHKRHFKATPSVRGPSIPFCTLDNFFDAKDFMKEKYSTLDLLLEIKIVTSKSEY